MSKQNRGSSRIVVISPKTLAIREAFIIALAQIGLRFDENAEPFFRMEGFKSDGKVTIKLGNNAGTVYVYGKGDLFFYIEKVEINKLDGEFLEHKEVVLFDNFQGGGWNLSDIYNCLLLHRKIHAYLILFSELGPIYAQSAVDEITQYPKVEVIDRKTVKITYEGRSSFYKLILWHNADLGYTKASIESGDR